MTEPTTVEASVRSLADTPHEDWGVGIEHSGMKGMRFRREESGTFTCAACGKGDYKTPNSVQGHWNLQCDAKPERAEHDASRANAMLDPMVGPVVRSKRGRRRLGTDRAPTVLEEI